MGRKKVGAKLIVLWLWCQFNAMVTVGCKRIYTMFTTLEHFHNRFFTVCYDVTLQFGFVLLFFSSSHLLDMCVCLRISFRCSKIHDVAIQCEFTTSNTLFFVYFDRGVFFTLWRLLQQPSETVLVHSVT